VSQPRHESRNSNALACGLAFISIFNGAPRVAEGLPFVPNDMLTILNGESGGRERAEAFLGRPFEYLGPDASAYTVVADRLRAFGHGSSALVVNGWPASVGSGTHAWNAYNYQGRLGWVDTSVGRDEDRPLYPEPAAVWAIIVEPTWRPA
jgi:Papain fold toxin 1, glutamine deamidase